MHHLCAGYGWGQILFDVLNHELRAGCMRNKRTRRRFIHGIREVSHKDAMNTPTRQVANSKAAIEDAHVGMHTHVEDRVDPALLKDIVDFRTTVGNHIAPSNG